MNVELAPRFVISVLHVLLHQGLGRLGVIIHNCLHQQAATAMERKLHGNRVCAHLLLPKTRLIVRCLIAGFNGVSSNRPVWPATLDCRILRSAHESNSTVADRVLAAVAGCNRRGRGSTSGQIGPRNYLPSSRVFHVPRELPKYRGGNTNRFHRGDQGEVVLDCGGEANIASTDGGQTWQRCAGERPGTGIEVDGATWSNVVDVLLLHEADEDTSLRLTGFNLYRRTDGSDHWEQR